MGFTGKSNHQKARTGVQALYLALTLTAGSEGEGEVLPQHTVHHLLDFPTLDPWKEEQQEETVEKLGPVPTVAPTPAPTSRRRPC